MGDPSRFLWMRVLRLPRLPPPEVGGDVTDNMTMDGGVRCPRCGNRTESLSGLRIHFEAIHPEMGVRDRSVGREIARREAGWWGVRR